MFDDVVHVHYAENSKDRITPHKLNYLKNAGVFTKFCTTSHPGLSVINDYLTFTVNFHNLISLPLVLDRRVLRVVDSGLGTFSKE